MDTTQQTDLFGPTSAVDTGVGAALFLFGAIIVLTMLVVMIASLWRLFTKAGEEGWKALVPIYNSWVFLRLGGQPGWWAILAIVPFLNIVSFVFTCIAAYRIGLNLQKEGWFVVLYILAAPVWFVWLAFDSSTWKGDNVSTVPAAAPGFQPAAPAGVPTPSLAPQPPVSQPPVFEQPGQNQNNTPPTPPSTS